MLPINQAEPVQVNRRILVIDDNPAIHDDFKKILQPSQVAAADLDALEGALFGGSAKEEIAQISYEMGFAFQGLEAIDLIKERFAQKRPYAMAFLDIRMPPGIDGIEALERIWKIDPELQVVICSAYSDYCWEDMLLRFGRTDRLVILKKPFDNMEVQQLANAMTEKWRLLQVAKARVQDLEVAVSARTAQLEKANASLAAEIVRHVQTQDELRAARDTAETASQAKTVFLANVSHEIRTPLNGVIGIGSLLLEAELTQMQRELVVTLNQSGEALLAIVNEILDFAKIEAGKLVLDDNPFDLEELVAMAVDLQARQAASKHLEIICDFDASTPTLLHGDLVRVRQVLFNLLGNAVKFTEHGEITVKVYAVETTTENTLLRFEVTDTGIGIAPETLPRLFQAFTQADASTTRRFGGTGLGLAICKRIVELLGGEIGVRSTLGKGSTFWFTARIGIFPEAEKNNIDASDIRILVVDDNAASRQAIRRYLESLKCSVEIASATPAALDAIRTSQKSARFFSAVLIDQNMPGADGLMLARTITMDFPDPKPVMFLMTPPGELLESALLKNLSIENIVTKPAKPADLRRVIEAARKHKPAPRPEIAPSARLPQFPDLKVLVADDNPVNRQVASHQLRLFGIKADIALNGKEAVDAFLQKNYDIVFMDAQMPVMDGVEATRLIRLAQQTNPAVPSHTRIIAMTANAADSDRQRLLAAGMNDYVSKPVVLDTLRDTLLRNAEILGFQPAAFPVSAT